MTTFVTRAQWGAKPAKPGGNRFGQILGTAVHWEASAPPALHSNCAAAVRQIQAFHMGPQRGWNDIAYNLIACNHDYLFEGRQGGTAANGTDYGNEHFPAVCWLGGPGHTPEDGALTAIVSAHSKLGGLDRPIYPHSHFYSTACPGPFLTSWVKAGAHPPGGSKPKPPQVPVRYRVTFTNTAGEPVTQDHPIGEIEEFFRNYAENHAKDPAPSQLAWGFYPEGVPE